MDPASSQKGPQEATESPLRLRDVQGSVRHHGMPYSDNVWYHVTDRSRLPEIAKQGLVGSEHGTERVWSEFPVEHQAVYLWPQAAQAWQYFQGSFHPEGDDPKWADPVVLRIQGIDRNKLAPDHENFASWWADRLYNKENDDKYGWGDDEDREMFDRVAPYMKGFDIEFEDFEGYQFAIDALRKMPSDLREDLARYLSQNSGHAVMYYGVIHPSQISMGSVYPSFEHAYEAFSDQYPHEEPTGDEELDQWYEDKDRAFDEWSRQNPYLDDNAYEEAQNYLDYPENDEFSRYFNWMPLVQQDQDPRGPMPLEMRPALASSDDWNVSEGQTTLRPWAVDMTRPEHPNAVWIGERGEFHSNIPPEYGKGVVDEDVSPPHFQHYGMPQDQQALPYVQRYYHKMFTDQPEMKREANLEDFHEEAAEQLENYEALARDIMKTLPEEDWPQWVHNQEHRMVWGAPEPFQWPKPEFSMDTKPYDPRDETTIPEDWINPHEAAIIISDDQSSQYPSTGQEAPQASQVPQGQIAYWPSWEDIDTISRLAVDNHQGYRDPGLIEGAVGNTQMQQHYGAHADIFETAAHLLAKIQRQQAIVEGNKRTAAMVAMHFLEENGYDTTPLTDDAVWPQLDSAIMQVSESADDTPITTLAEIFRQYCKPMVHTSAEAGINCPHCKFWFRPGNTNYKCPNCGARVDWNPWMPDEWNSKTANIIQAKPEDLNPSDWEDPQFEYRTPYVYHKPTGQMFMGLPGYYHYHIEDWANRQLGKRGHFPNPEYIHGSLMNFGDKRKTHAVWPPPEDPRIWQHLEELTGRPINKHMDLEYGAHGEEEDGDDWTLSKTADASLDTSNDNWWGPQSVTLNQNVDIPGDPKGMGNPHDTNDTNDTNVNNDGNNWLYLNGKVAFGGHYWDLAHRLATELKLDPSQIAYISNSVARNSLPPEYDVAYGEMVQGRPQIWLSTIDRNHVWDEVMRNQQVAHHNPVSSVLFSNQRVAGIRVEEVPTGPDYYTDPDEQWMDRRPFFWLPDENTILLGDRGSHHDNIAGYLEDDSLLHDYEEDNPDVIRGCLTGNSWNRRLTQPIMLWGHEDKIPLISQALQPHLQELFKTSPPPQDDDDFTLSKTANEWDVTEDLPETRHFKWMRDEDSGVPLTVWPVDNSTIIEYDGRPSHAEKYEELTGRWNTPWECGGFSLMPDGSIRNNYHYTPPPFDPKAWLEQQARSKVKLTTTNWSKRKLGLG